MVLLSPTKLVVYAKFHSHRSLTSSFVQSQTISIKITPSAFELQIGTVAAVRPISSSSNMVKAIRVHELGGPEVLFILCFDLLLSNSIIFSEY